MKRVFVLGAGPLLEEQGTRFTSGQCLRTLHFARPLREAGHEVTLVTVPIEPPEAGKASAALQAHVTDERLRYKAFLTQDEEAIVARLRSTLRRHAHDAVVGVNAYPSYLLSRAQPDAPFWADLNGWTLAEGATRAARVGHDGDMDHFWRLEVAALLAADRFSTASSRQANALFGELALVGRLGARTFDWPFVEAVPNAAYPLYAGLKRDAQAAAEVVAPGEPVVLWSGGFNTWTDPALVVEALGVAMRAHPAMHFVATGGAVRGHDDATFEKFRALAAARLPQERVHLLGWVETGLVAALHARADVGINVDAPNVETLFGARNRLTNMLAAGVPVATTEGTEIADWITRNHAGAVTPAGDAGALGEAMAALLADPAAARRRAARARKKALEDFDPARTLEAFLAWAAEPRRAPDRPRGGARALTSPPRPGVHSGASARDWAHARLDGGHERLLEDARRLAQIRASLPARLLRRLRDTLRRPRREPGTTR